MKDIVLSLDCCVSLDFPFTSSQAERVLAGRQRHNHCRNEVQLPCTSVIVHAQFAVHTDVPHSHPLHTFTLHTISIHIHILVSVQVHSNPVQLDILHSIVSHTILQIHIFLHSFIQQRVPLQFNTARTSTGKSCTCHTCCTCKKNCALPQ